MDTLESLVQPVLAISADMPIDDVGRLLVDRRVPALGVVDSAGHLRGLITRTDVLRALDEDLATASDAMTWLVFSLPAGADVERAAALMAYEGVGQVLVIGRGGELVGMVSALDVARHYASHAGFSIS
ncbi:MAG TPA: CBS domain-containing protein [Kofleriaceae bacterium]|jgi:CBS domain-containing protein